MTKLTEALDLLTKLPDGPERIQRELPLQLALASALIPIKGWASSEVPRAYARVRELAERIANPLLGFRALVGLWSVHLIRAEIRTASVLAEQALRIAQGAGDSTLLLLAHSAMGGRCLAKESFLCRASISRRQYLFTSLSAMDRLYCAPRLI
jgi:hypothetical protein